MPKNITITPTSIVNTNSPNVVIMDSAETPLMEKFAQIVTQNGGDILEVGFGLGISAEFIYRNNINSYTCIEIHPEIYQNALKWAQDKKNVKIILGDWIDIIPKLDVKFDGIFMDTFEYLNYNKFEEYCLNIANIDCVLSIFDYKTQPNKSLYFIEFKMDKIDYLKNKTIFRLFYSHFNGDGFVKRKKSNSLI
jgi:SAM-dependent methyltransferase